MTTQIDKETAVVISFNWRTQETVHQVFEGSEAADKAVGWCHANSFIWRDFPSKNGWTHFYHATPQAMEKKGRRNTDELMYHGRITARYTPQ